MLRLRHLTAATTVVVLAAVPAFAGHGGVHPTFRSEEVFFTCAGPTKLHQANWAMTLGDPSANPSWTTTAPSQSVQEGAGCGAADWGGTTNVVYSPIFEGTVTGNLRDLTIRVHELLTHASRTSGTETLRLYAELNGTPLFPAGTQPANGRTVEVTPTVTNSGATALYEFSITGLGFAEDVLDEAGDVVGVSTGGAVRENGDGTRKRTLTIFLGVHGTAFGQSPAGHKGAAWAWGTTEAPGGITFNPPTLAEATVAADLPSGV
jgi:hypothetical protein